MDTKNSTANTATKANRNGVRAKQKPSRAKHAKQKPSRAKLRGLRTLDDLDARTSGYRRARELIGGFEQDLGGADHLTTGQHQLAQRASVYGALIESYEVQWLESRVVDPNWFAATNVQRRVLRDLGLERRAKDVTPPSLADIAAEIEAEREADDG
ncbi:hypothetical protein ACFLEY_02360 [Bradyrhizobium sp. YCK136]|uniref:hypothetical protein n=1 Tax=Bradyrhizobium TaxID=374 RepID=UPI0007660D10|nr:hypothetical protein [Bradyrhizobium diazoefficiens]MBR0868646.1 hypothetical protein [Bradyrhizobium diazoefficiens]MBR0893175.1 hypothetical protein [Bradyrhizobium diazoefficiens]MBR0924885.1 hypothetical protein [Bradyrhizobium diazoefficiens]